MKSLFLTIAVTTFAAPPIFSQQEWLGMNVGNYAGVTGLRLQPASIADNRMNVDVTLGAFDFNLYNNFAKFKSGMLTSESESWKDYFMFDYSPGGKSLFLNLGVQLPSFMFSTPKWGAGLGIRFRNHLTITGVGGELAELIATDFKEERLHDVLLKNPRTTLNLLPVLEFALPVGAVVWKSEPHFVKAGATVKYLIGGPTVGVRLNPSDYTFLSKDELIVPSGTDVYFAGSFGFVFDDAASEFTLQPGASFGFDLGAVYEWRPRPDSVYRYDMDGKTGLERKDLNKYRFRGGVSLIDLGWVRYRTAFNRAYRVRANREMPGVPLDWHYWNIANLSIDNLEELDSTLSSRFEQLHASSGLTVPLPAAVSFQADWNVMDLKGVYLSLTTVHGFRLSRWAPRGFHTFTFAPRYEHRWVGAALPLTLNEMGQADLGLSVMLGPLLLGTNSLNGLFAAQTNRLHVFAALRIPIPYGPPRDRDGDKVSNRKDKCRREPGLWENRGCPEELKVVNDRDGDGVLDNEDQCPDQAGTAAAKGCPDKDKDGIADADDACPDVYGLASLKGCPDTDGDGIPDNADACPRTPGLAEFLGCPDTDGDGVPDSQDECPDKPGLASQDGCPDTDGDGVYDHRDRCPQEPGSRENLGCPQTVSIPTDDTDTDEDGVIDRLDDCPLTPGVPELKGCPPLPKDVAEVVKTAFDNLEFESGRATIKPQSLDELKKLADLLIRKPEYKLVVAGHTDNVGNKDFNMKLSLERANAVRTKLMEYGVPSERIVTEGYGDTMPIAPNTTPEGRALNRRVELKLLRF